MEEKAKKRRDWIKNITIIFLAVMLALTFFSNTIMNYSLPEVSAQYSTSGDVANKVRGNATVEAVEPYEIKLEEQRKVEAVKIKSGDTIKKGQVLFELGDSDGTALDEARDALDAANLEYQQKLVENSPDYTSSNLDIEFAKEDYEKAVADLKEGRTKYKTLTKKVNTLTKTKNTAEETVSTLKKEVNTLKREVSKLTEKKANPEVLEEQEAYDKAQEEYDNLVELAGADANNNYDVARAAAQVKVNKASKALEKAKKQKAAEIGVQLEATEEKYDTADDNLSEATTDLETATAKLEEAKTEQKAVSIEELEKNIDTTRRAYEKLVAELEKTMGDDANKQSVTSVELQNASKKIARLEKKVARLEKSGATNEVVSKVEGIVSNVNYVAGDTTTAETALAVIELTDRGYSAKLSITNAQSKLVREGNEAEILNVWGEEIKATVKSIKNDPDNPGKNRLVTFTVTGDVSVGQSLELAVGEQSAYYDTIVPNSAIREDNKGKFVLAVQVKSSPLGNRYIATRLDVQVLASDETSTAISGSATGSEFILTTSTKPVEAGMQVRLVEGGDV